MTKNEKPLFVTIPHSGEQVPDFCHWLKGLSEPVLMCDVDRYVDVLYEPSLQQLNIPYVKTQWHRYAADLNRVPADVDASSVLGSSIPAGKNNRGFHWVITTKGEQLMPAPITQQVHEQLVSLIYQPFHLQVQNQYEQLKAKGYNDVFHLDVHSMPSVGTDQHRDPGQTRAEIVVSDCHGKSSNPKFVDIVIAAYVKAGFRVGYNWPYFGGRVSEQYGQPNRGQHAVQVELSRALYMDEVSKKIKPDSASSVQVRLTKALESILNQL